MLPYGIGAGVAARLHAQVSDRNRALINGLGPIGMYIALFFEPAVLKYLAGNSMRTVVRLLRNSYMKIVGSNIDSINMVTEGRI